MTPELKLTPAVIDIILKHDWPGNVRELENAMERLIVLSDHGDLPSGVLQLDRPRVQLRSAKGSGDPKDVSEAKAKKELNNKSILDFVTDDAKSLGGTLGQGDKRKLDEYLTAVREVEQRIEKAKKINAERKPAAKPDMAAPTGTPKEMKDHVRLMCDLMVLAYQTDTWKRQECEVHRPRVSETFGLHILRE